MISQESVDNLPEDRRREIFLALVDAQDHEMTVSQSREAVAARFGVSEEQVRKIEREGLDNNWPPL
jgi:DNA-directed RNA polymerase sigma subunit (sigma70/sigma32)